MKARVAAFLRFSRLCGIRVCSMNYGLTTTSPTLIFFRRSRVQINRNQMILVTPVTCTQCDIDKCGSVKACLETLIASGDEALNHELYWLLA